MVFHFLAFFITHNFGNKTIGVWFTPTVHIYILLFDHIRDTIIDKRKVI